MSSIIALVIFAIVAAVVFALGKLWEQWHTPYTPLGWIAPKVPGAASEPEEVARAVQADWPDTIDRMYEQQNPFAPPSRIWAPPTGEGPQWTINQHRENQK